MRLISIPEKPSVKLSCEVYYFMLMQVPIGRLTRGKDIDAYLARKFGVHHISEFDTEPMNRRVLQYGSEYVSLIHINVPQHREVSPIGYLENSMVQAEQLIAEGFNLETKGPHNKYAVKDYKKYLFNFDKETNISLETLQDIDQNSLIKYFKWFNGIQVSQ